MTYWRRPEKQYRLKAESGWCYVRDPGKNDRVVRINREMVLQRHGKDRYLTELDGKLTLHIEIKDEDVEEMGLTGTGGDNDERRDDREEDEEGKVE